MPNFELWMSKDGRCHCIPNRGDLPRDMSRADFDSAVLVQMQINLDSKSAEIAALKTEIETIKANAEAEVKTLSLSADAFKKNATDAAHAARNAINDSTLDASATIAVVTAIVAQVLMPESERALVDALRQKQEIEDKIAKIKASIPKPDPTP